MMEVDDYTVPYKVHGIIVSDSDSDSGSLTEFDADYTLYQPPPLSYDLIKDKLVKISPPAVVKAWEEHLKSTVNIKNYTKNKASIGPIVLQTKKKKKKKAKSLANSQNGLISNFGSFFCEADAAKHLNQLDVPVIKTKKKKKKKASNQNGLISDSKTLICEAELNTQNIDPKCTINTKSDKRNEENMDVTLIKTKKKKKKKAKSTASDQNGLVCDYKSLFFEADRNKENLKVLSTQDKKSRNSTQDIKFSPVGNNTKSETSAVCRINNVSSNISFSLCEHKKKRQKKSELKRIYNNEQLNVIDKELDKIKDMKFWGSKEKEAKLLKRKEKQMYENWYKHATELASKTCQKTQDKNQNVKSSIIEANNNPGATKKKKRNKSKSTEQSKTSAICNINTAAIQKANDIQGNKYGYDLVVNYTKKPSHEDEEMLINPQQSTKCMNENKEFNEENNFSRDLLDNEDLNGVWWNFDQSRTTCSSTELNNKKVPKKKQKKTLNSLHTEGSLNKQIVNKNKTTSNAEDASPPSINFEEAYRSLINHDFNASNEQFFNIEKYAELLRYLTYFETPNEDTKISSLNSCSQNKNVADCNEIITEEKIEPEQYIDEDFPPLRSKAESNFDWHRCQKWKKDSKQATNPTNKKKKKTFKPFDITEPVDYLLHEDISEGDDIENYYEISSVCSQSRETNTNVNDSKRGTSTNIKKKLKPFGITESVNYLVHEDISEGDNIENPYEIVSVCSPSRETNTNVKKQKKINDSFDIIESVDHLVDADISEYESIEDQYMPLLFNQYFDSSSFELCSEQFVNIEKYVKLLSQLRIFDTDFEMVDKDTKCSSQNLYFQSANDTYNEIAEEKTVVEKYIDEDFPPLSSKAECSSDFDWPRCQRLKRHVQQGTNITKKKKKKIFKPFDITEAVDYLVHEDIPEDDNIEDHNDTSFVYTTQYSPQGTNACDQQNNTFKPFEITKSVDHLISEYISEGIHFEDQYTPFFNQCFDLSRNIIAQQQNIKEELVFDKPMAYVEDFPALNQHAELSKDIIKSKEDITITQKEYCRKYVVDSTDLISSPNETTSKKKKKSNPLLKIELVSEYTKTDKIEPINNNTNLDVEDKNYIFLNVCPPASSSNAVISTQNSTENVDSNAVSENSSKKKRNRGKKKKKSNTLLEYVDAQLVHNTTIVPIKDISATAVSSHTSINKAQINTDEDFEINESENNIISRSYIHDDKIIDENKCKKEELAVELEQTSFTTEHSISLKDHNVTSSYENFVYDNIFGEDFKDFLQNMNPESTDIMHIIGNFKYEQIYRAYKAYQEKKSNKINAVLSYAEVSKNIVENKEDSTITQKEYCRKYVADSSNSITSPNKITSPKSNLLLKTELASKYTKTDKIESISNNTNLDVEDKNYIFLNVCPQASSSSNVVVSTQNNTENVDTKQLITSNIVSENSSKKKRNRGKKKKKPNTLFEYIDAQLVRNTAIVPIKDTSTTAANSYTSINQAQINTGEDFEINESENNIITRSYIDVNKCKKEEFAVELEQSPFTTEHSIALKDHNVTTSYENFVYDNIFGEDFKDFLQNMNPESTDIMRMLDNSKYEEIYRAYKAYQEEKSDKINAVVSYAEVSKHIVESKGYNTNTQKEYCRKYGVDSTNLITSPNELTSHKSNLLLKTELANEYTKTDKIESISNNTNLDVEDKNYIFLNVCPQASSSSSSNVVVSTQNSTENVDTKELITSNIVSENSSKKKRNRVRKRKKGYTLLEHINAFRYSCDWDYIDAQLVHNTTIVPIKDTSTTAVNSHTSINKTLINTDEDFEINESENNIVTTSYIHDDKIPDENKCKKQELGVDLEQSSFTTEHSIALKDHNVTTSYENFVYDNIFGEDFKDFLQNMNPESTDIMNMLGNFKYEEIYRAYKAYQKKKSDKINAVVSYAKVSKDIVESKKDNTITQKEYCRKCVVDSTNLITSPNDIASKKSNLLKTELASEYTKTDKIELISNNTNLDVEDKNYIFLNVCPQASSSNVVVSTQNSTENIDTKELITSNIVSENSSKKKRNRGKKKKKSNTLLEYIDGQLVHNTTIVPIEDTSTTAVNSHASINKTQINTDENFEINESENDIVLGYMSNDVKLHYYEFEGKNFKHFMNFRELYFSASIDTVAKGRKNTVKKPESSINKEIQGLRILKDEVQCHYYDFEGKNFNRFMEFREKYLCSSIDDAGKSGFNQTNVRGNKELSHCLGYLSNDIKFHYYEFEGKNFKHFMNFRELYLSASLDTVAKRGKSTVKKPESSINSINVAAQPEKEPKNASIKQTTNSDGFEDKNYIFLNVCPQASSSNTVISTQNSTENVDSNAVSENSSKKKRNKGKKKKKSNTLLEYIDAQLVHNTTIVPIKDISATAVSSHTSINKAQINTDEDFEINESENNIVTTSYIHDDKIPDENKCKKEELGVELEQSPFTTEHSIALKDHNVTTSYENFVYDNIFGEDFKDFLQNMNPESTDIMNMLGNFKYEEIYRAYKAYQKKKSDKINAVVNYAEVSKDIVESKKDNTIIQKEYCRKCVVDSTNLITSPNDIASKNSNLLLKTEELASEYTKTDKIELISNNTNLDVEDKNYIFLNVCPQASSSNVVVSTQNSTENVDTKEIITSNIVSENSSRKKRNRGKKKKKSNTLLEYIDGQLVHNTTIVPIKDTSTTAVNSHASINKTQINTDENFEINESENDIVLGYKSNDVKLHYYEFEGENFKHFMNFRELYLSASLDTVAKRGKSTVKKPESSVNKEIQGLRILKDDVRCHYYDFEDKNFNRFMEFREKYLCSSLDDAGKSGFNQTNVRGNKELSHCLGYVSNDIKLHYYEFEGKNFKHFMNFRELYFSASLDAVAKRGKRTVKKPESSINSINVAAQPEKEPKIASIMQTTNSDVVNNSFHLGQYLQESNWETLTDANNFTVFQRILHVAFIFFMLYVTKIILNSLFDNVIYICLFFVAYLIISCNRGL